jgi:dihydroorotate dehydrogenase electron transfer subunit
MMKEDVKVVSQKEIARNIYEITVQGEVVASMTSPGQFVHLRVSDQYTPLLRRPISICDVDLENKELTMLYRAEGEGTKLLSKKAIGDTVDILGPLGNGFPLDALESGETALLVGGGIGVPPLYYLSKELKKRGVQVIHVLGFASDTDMFYKEEFEGLGETYISTVDGTFGTKGFVTDVISQEQLKYDALFACGPTPMLKAIDTTVQPEVGFYSLEERMGCGIGACFACVCHVHNDPTNTKYVKICSDGPVFPVGEVVL